jgi:hypothetical protein
MLASGTPDGDGALTARTIVIMKQGDAAQQKQQELRAWQRGASGVVLAVNQSTCEIVLRGAPGQSVTVHTTPKTEFLRYSPNSAQFKDASKGSFADVKAGDQLRARGSRNGNEVNADAVISGTFPTYAATVSSVDAGQNSLVVQDLATKKPVTLKVTPESQLHQLPQAMATHMAMMIKGRTGQGAGVGTQGPASGTGSATSGQAPRHAQGGTAAGSGAPGAGGASRAAGGDLQGMLSRTPTVALGDLKKGDAVVLLATQGGTVVTLISGVEPILTASPNGGGAAELLSGWNMGEPAGAEGAGSQ